MEVRAQLPIPSVGEVIVVPDDRGGSSGYEVLAKRLSYRSDSRCVVTLRVSASDA
ncbi:hypothetical protein [Paludisphaera mucosa]|uniref:Uncharacterized protein n=1 Tax=Paludisphaera mucosa TaxID=3030827 RepID=A0ABT6FKU0_9BACT|nr:hypothetical protein [Paludisphaera mucosa]MDG3007993.1 hypothetical protein [Paludisphaera mucosa]